MFCSRNVVCQAFLFHHGAWAVQRGGVDLLRGTLIHTAICIVLTKALRIEILFMFCSAVEKKFADIIKFLLFSPPPQGWCKGQAWTSSWGV